MPIPRLHILHRFAPILLLGILAIATGCTSFRVLQQAAPNPFVRVRDFAVLPMTMADPSPPRFVEGLFRFQMAASAEGDQMWAIGLQSMGTTFVQEMARQGQGTFTIHTQPPLPPGAFLVRVLVEPAELHRWQNQWGAPISISMRPRFLIVLTTQSGEVLDRVLVDTAGIVSVADGRVPNYIELLPRVAAFGADLTLQYLRSRTQPRH